MAMFRQTLRDAVVTRETRATSQRIEKISQHVETVAETSIVNEKELCSLILRLEDQDKELMKQTNYLIELIEHAKANRQNEAQ